MVFRLISDIQPIVAGVTRPKSVYSRVVSCEAYIKGEVTVRGFTPPVGINVWLHGINVWVTPNYVGVAGASMSFRILYGTGTPATPALILNWENILPVYWPDGVIRPWAQYQPFYHQHWDMNRLFSKAGQRFGIWLEVSGFVPVLELVASFEVSEG